MKLRARNEIRERWEEKHAAEVVEILRTNGPTKRSKIAKKLGLTDHSLESIMAEVNAHHYLHSWKDDGQTVYKIVETR